MGQWVQPDFPDAALDKSAYAIPGQPGLHEAH
jgi:hypothetical protein